MEDEDQLDYRILGVVERYASHGADLRAIRYGLALEGGYCPSDEVLAERLSWLEDHGFIGPCEWEEGFFPLSGRWVIAS